ncbi:MAG: hypothetical protein NZ703_12895, partial [Gemmataceae bacterium]|nr:hypothetical protein [Gemmataceae bacterium]
MATGMLADLSLNQFELLRAFKIRRCQPGADNHSPFVDRVASHYETPPAVDVAQIHETVRQNIIEQIQAVHRQQRSQIVLRAGEAGAGKTHLLRYFARPDLAGKYKYVFVSGSNDWKVEEFQPCVLDWLITALTRPAPTQEHLLLQRIRAIAFRALDQLVANRTVLRRCRAKRRWLGWLLGRRRGSHELIQRLTQARDPRVFEYLDFNEFADEVSLRFLAEPSNPIHRYALRVLLSYVFPDDTPGGLNIRDRVIHWFRRRPDDGYWLRRLGVDENLDRRYVVADAIKLLIHLFSPELSAQLSTERECHEPRIFLLAFDQAEGRQALFDSHEDWKRFFAHLSELYNNLPNLLIIFTMTLQLRHELHDGMERQFRDRIRMDDRFVLMRPEPEQIRELYRARLRHWLKDDVLLQQQYLDLPSSEQYLPFTPESVVQIAGNASLREALENLDRAFAERLRELVIGPNYDFEYVRAEQERLAEEQPDYVNDHLVTVRSLLERLGEELNYHYGLRLEISEHRSE